MSFIWFYFLHRSCFGLNRKGIIIPLFPSGLQGNETLLHLSVPWTLCGRRNFLMHNSLGKILDNFFLFFSLPTFLQIFQRNLALTPSFQRDQRSSLYIWCNVFSANFYRLWGCWQLPSLSRIANSDIYSKSVSAVPYRKAFAEIPWTFVMLMMLSLALQCSKRSYLLPDESYVWSQNMAIPFSDKIWTLSIIKPQV